MRPGSGPGAAIPPAAPVRAAPLQLVVRRQGGAGGGDALEHHAVDSGRALLRMRPRRVADVVVEARELGPEEGGGCVLHVRSSGVYLRLTPDEVVLWDLMDGTATMQEIATVAFLRSRSFDPAPVLQLLSRVRKAGLIELRPAGWLRLPVPPAMAREWRWEGVDPWVKRAREWLRPVLNRWTVGPWALACVAATLWHVVSPPPAPSLPLWQAALAVPAVWLLGLLPHESGHALACAAFGRRVRAVGVGWTGAWVDTSDMFLSGRAAHGLVALAGPAASFAAAAALSLVARWTHAPVVALAADTLLAQGLVTGWPFLGPSNDGQKALGDLLLEPRLGHDAWRLLRGGPRRRALWSYGFATLATWVVLAGWLGSEL